MSGTGAQEGTKIAEWKADIERILANSADKAPGDLIEELCGLATAMGDDAAEEVLAANPGLFNHADALKRANFERIIRQDVNETRRLLAGTWASRVRFPDVASPRRVLSYNRSREMFDLIDFRDCQRAVMVGCGSLPFTMYHIEDRTDVPDIVGLDILPDAIATAKELSEKLGYARVRFELHDGQIYDFRDAQVVYIASTATPKRAVMSRIAETASAGTRIISRDPYSLARLWVEDSEGHRDPRIDVAGHGDGIWSLTRDVYFRRRSNSGAAMLNR